MAKKPKAKVKRSPPRVHYRRGTVVKKPSAPTGQVKPSSGQVKKGTQQIVQPTTVESTSAPPTGWLRSLLGKTITLD